MSDMRHLPTKGAYNIRDLGGYTTKTGGATRWRRFLRSDSLHRIAPGEAERLYDAGLRMVVDLRTADEVATKPSPFAAFPNVRFENLPLFDDLSPQALSKTKVEGAHPLLSFYTNALETRGVAIRSILSSMAQIEKGAVLFNCTAGKDRTGIIAALLLGIADVPSDQIIADYTLTAEYIPELVAEFLELSRANGGDVKSYARLLESPAPTMAAILEHVHTHYGSMQAYLEQIGLPKEAYTSLQTRLVSRPD